MLLAQIKSNYSSGGDSSSDDEEDDDDEEEEEAEEKKSSRKTKKEDKSDEKDEGAAHAATRRQLDLLRRASSPLKPTFSPFFLPDDEDSEGSSSDGNVKKRGKRHKLLRHKLSLSEDESGEEKGAGKEKKKGGKKSRKKGCSLCLVPTALPRCESYQPNPPFFLCVCVFLLHYCQSAATTPKILTLRRKDPKVKSRKSPKRSVSLRETGNGGRRGEEALLRQRSITDAEIYRGRIWLHLLRPFEFLSFFLNVYFSVLQSYAEEG